MEEAWRAKCSPAWRPLPASSPPASTPLPAPPPAPPPSSGNQMDRNSRQLLHPFGQDTNFGHSLIFQEPNVFNTLNLDSCKSGEADNSFLDLLSGHTSRNFLQLSSSPSKLDTLHVQHGDIANNLSCNIPITNSPSPAKNHRNGVQRNCEFSPFVASLSLPLSNNASCLHNDFQVEASKSHVLNSGNRVPHPTFQGNKGAEVSSGKHGQATSSSPLNASQQYVLNHPIQEVPWGAKPSPSHTSSNFVGRPRVFCMNRVGELFLSETGLLGVVCLCHEIPMSVPKFCEHSGSPSANPGDAVHLENGMTLAQWRSLCFGVISSDHRNGWEWSGASQPEGGFPRPKFNNASTLLRGSAPIGSIESFGVLGKFGEHRNTFALPNHTDRGTGQSAVEKAASKATDNTHHMNPFPNSAKSTMPVVSKNQIVQAMKESPVWMSFDGSNLSPNKGKESVGSHLTSNNACYMNEMGKYPTESPCSGFRNSFISENDIRNGKLSSGMNSPFSYNRGNFSSEASSRNQGGVSSNIELRLGHASGPSQNSQTFLRCFAEEVHPPQLRATSNLQNRSSHQHLTSNHFPKETKESRLNLQFSQPDSQSLSIRQTHHSLRNNSSRLPDLEDPLVDATKSSLISFLSHLNTGEKNPLQSTNISGSNSEDLMNDSLYTRPNISDLARGMPGITEMKSKTNESQLNERNQGKRSIFFDSSSSITVKPSYLVYKKEPLDASGLSSVVGGHCFHKSSMLDQRPTLHLNQPSGILQTAQCRSSSHNKDASFQGNMGSCNHATPRYTTPVPSETTVTDFINCRTPVSLDATNSIFMREPNSSLLYNKSSDRTKNLRTDSLRSFSSRDVARLSKPEQSAFSLETSTQPGRLYSRTDIEKRNVSQGGLITNKVLREGPFCFSSKEAHHFSVGSGHSFSNCRSAGDSQMLAAMPDITNAHNCYNCTASPQVISLCSEEHGIQFYGRPIHHSNEQNCLRLEGVSSNSFSDNVKHWRCNQKEESSSFSGKCCCSFVPKYWTGCCFSGHDKPCSSLSEHVCKKTMLENPTYTREYMGQNNEQVRLGQCACLKNHSVVKNDCQLVLQRDTPSKLIGHCGSTSTKMPGHVLQSIQIVGDKPARTAVKDLDGTCQELESTKEHHMSNVSSGSSAPAVTDVSIEVNNVVSLATDVESTKIVRNSVVDEGSGIEKCSSSDEVLDSRVYEDQLRPGKLSSIKRSGNHLTAGCASYKNTSKAKKLKRVLKSGKRNRAMSIPVLSVSGSPNHVGQSFCHFSSQHIDLSPCSDSVMQETSTLSCRPSSIKKKRSTLSSTKPFSLEGLENNQKTRESNNKQPFDEDLSLGIEEVSAGRKAKQDSGELEKQFAKHKNSYAIDGKPPKYVSLSCIGNSVNHGVDSSRKKLKPVVCGNSGIISSGMDAQQKPAKFLSLSLILQRSSGCNTPEYTRESEEKFVSHNKKTCLDTNSESCNAPSWKVQPDNEGSCAGLKNQMDSIKFAPVKNKKCSKKRSRHMPGLSIIRSEADCESNKTSKSGLHLGGASSRSKARCKGIRMSSLSKITGTVKPILISHSLQEHGENDDTNMMEAGNQMKASTSTVNEETFIGNELHNDLWEVLRCASSSDRLVNNSLNDQDQESEPGIGNKRSSSKGRKCLPFLSDSEAFCCVCGSSNREDNNSLLECNRCLIKVHQACYGVRKVPKGHWYCRPCKSNSSGIVCVLCGYGGGAMTRALKSGSIVKKLLKAWKVETGSNNIDPIPLSAAKNEFVKSSSVGEASECDSLVPGVGSSINTEAFSADASKIDSEDMKVNNSITAGLVDQSVTQWVHMVCGLWTPGTRCPNVDTMSAFDVSGALSTKKNNVCSMCSRPGGSSIQCRVLNCSVHFHPWCAHQKGLLQSEIEGDDNEKVGFYGRCMLHATHSSFHPQCNTADVDIGSPTRDWTCARTEGFKGRKRDQGFNPYHYKPSNKDGGCVVSQEQINAWLHINGQRSCIRGVAKPQFSDTECDTRKEYARYKQLKAWKRLIVYKSGIHGLGLYTSQYIAQGAMVVEYVGEIVGPHVADKREVEYQSGRRLQYKSACYFFRIDKEHIIDATRKGGIARFVNHSCLPNCVAKVISVRNEKKVVFFAERDIYPGEEITYDYHFSHEDEGKKIPCFCNSKNCRRYLN